MTDKPKKKKAILSKSTFIKGLQCPKALYLHKNRYFLRDPLSAEQLARFSRGTNVGVYAHNLFPGGVDASPKTHFQMAQSVVKTAGLMQQPDVNVIYEAAFEYEEVIVALDILYREKGKWKAVEVKSSRGISDTYRWDAALQYYVICGSGIELEDFSIAYINQDYKRQGPVDAHGLFQMESLIDEVKQKRAEIEQKIKELKEVSQLKSSPATAIGLHCNDPYPCDFQGHCWKKVSPDSVFLLEGISEKQKFEWHQSGIESVVDLPAEAVSENNLGIQVQSIREKKVIVDKTALSDHLQTTGVTGVFQPFVFAPVIPFFDHTSPYQPLPFGVGSSPTDSFAPEMVKEIYSSYSLETAIRNMLKVTEEFDSLWVFDISRIKLLLDSCRKLFPAMENDLELLSSKLKDLLTPLKKEMIVYPGLKAPLSPEKILKHFGAKSIKSDGKCMIPEQADALFQKLLSAPEAESNPEAEALIKAFMLSKTENNYRLLQLWRSFTK